MESPKKNPQRVRTRYPKEFKLEAIRLGYCRFQRHFVKV